MHPEWPNDHLSNISSGTLNTVTNGYSTSYISATSAVTMNSNRCDFTRQFYNPNTSANNSLRNLVLNYTRNPKPVIVEKV